MDINKQSEEEREKASQTVKERRDMNAILMHTQTPNIFEKF